MLSSEFRQESDCVISESLPNARDIDSRDKVFKTANTLLNISRTLTRYSDSIIDDQCTRTHLAIFLNEIISSSNDDKLGAERHLRDIIIPYLEDEIRLYGTDMLGH